MPEETEARRLSQIVLNMLAENVPEKDIIINLQQAGLSAVKAKQVLEKAKQQFQEFSGKEINRVVEGRVSDTVDRQMAEARREFALQSDLKFTEQKGYVDKRIGELKSEIDALKSEVVGSKIDIDSKIKTALKRVQTLGVASTAPKALSIVLIIAGIFSIIAFLFFGYEVMNSLARRSPFDMYMFLRVAIVVLSLIIGIICLRLGGRAYSAGKKKFETVGMEWMEGKEEEQKRETIS